MPPNHRAYLGFRPTTLLHKGDYVGGGVSAQCGVPGCPPKPLGLDLISTAMTINTLVVLLCALQGWRTCDP